MEPDGDDDDGDDEVVVDAEDGLAELVWAWDSKPVRKQLLSPWLPLEMLTWHTEDACPAVHHSRTVDRPSAHAPAAPSCWPTVAATSMGEPEPAASERSDYSEEHAWLTAEEEDERTTVVAAAAGDDGGVVVWGR